MEKNKVNASKLILNNGVVLGIVGVIIQLIFYSLNQSTNQSWYMSAIPMLAIVVAIVLTFKAFKVENESFMTIGEGLKLGIGVVMISTVIGVLYTYIFINFIEPDFLANMVELQRETLMSQNFSDEQIEMSIKAYEMMSSTWILIATNLIGGLFIGFIFSLIISVIMKKNRVLEL